MKTRWKFLRKLAGIAVLPVAFASGCGSEAMIPEVEKSQDELLVGADRLWPRTIEVCWDINSTQVDGPGQTRYAQARERVRQAIAGSWEAVSRLKTTGWGNCPGPAPFGDRLLISARAGRSRAAVGKSGNNWIGLDLDTNVLPATAIHEFGHSLGFYHEQADPRTPSTCTENDGDLRSNPVGSIAVSEWDPTSIMNYCNANWWWGVLSPTDIAGVQRFYGARPHDATADRRDDIVLVNGSWSGLKVGRAEGSSFVPETTELWGLAPYISQGGRIVSGDFNGDGRLDYAVVAGMSSWRSIPVGISGAWGLTVTNHGAPNFPEWSYQYGVTAVVGDFNADGRDDIGLAGGAGWGSTPVALSVGDGTFNITNPAAGDFAIWATQAGARLLAGDFDGDGYSDMALVGGNGWNTIPVKFTRTTGSGFALTNLQSPEFAIWATQGSKPVTGDFNGDGRTDIALVGGNGWNTIPVAVSNGDGTFTVNNLRYDNFPTWATQGSYPVVGDYNDDGKLDIALVGGRDWNTVPVAYGLNFFGTQTFIITNNRADTVAAWAAVPGTRPVTNTALPRWPIGTIPKW